MQKLIELHKNSKLRLENVVNRIATEDESYLSAYEFGVYHGITSILEELIDMGYTSEGADTNDQ